ncbi:MAG TPA: polyprenyl synthetase family protein [Acidimicrobiales bacterium]
MRYSELSELLGFPELEATMDEVEDALVRCLTEGSDLLAVPAGRVARGGGKRLRAVLVLAASRALAPSRTHPEHAVRGAVSIELVHQGSLVHDDLLDGAESRRGTATVNALEGYDRAILVGDYILAKAGTMAASVSRLVAEDVAKSIEALCTGQVLEMADVGNPTRTLEGAIVSVGGKTADLILAACRVGAHCVVEDGEVVDRLSAYGHAFGLAYQLVDDVLDLVSTEELLGKPVGNDIRCGVFTVPVLLARDAIGDAAFADDLRASATDDDVAERTMAAVRSSGAVERTLDLARDYAAEARRSLEKIEHDYPDLARLARLPEAYIEWVTTTLVPEGALAPGVAAEIS